MPCPPRLTGGPCAPRAVLSVTRRVRPPGFVTKVTGPAPRSLAKIGAWSRAGGPGARLRRRRDRRAHQDAEDERLVKKVDLTVNGRPVQVVADDREDRPHRRPARRPWPDRRQAVLRPQGPVRDVHGPRRRQGRPFVPHEGGHARRARRSSPSRAWARRTSPHLVQQAFVLAGAVQCGFCIPGMIVTRRGAPGRQPGPHRATRSRPALRRNLCRCTGYAKIIDAVQLAGRFLPRRDHARPTPMPDPDDAQDRRLAPAPQRA